MAVAEQPAYTFIPPPPLPEFYLSNKDDSDEESNTSSSPSNRDAQVVVTKAIPVLGDGAYDGKKRSATMPRAAPTPLVGMPRNSLPNANGVPPLAIYHICRICLRPRSPRYHREHPIPVDGLPPPPGICRRCRVMSVEETKKVAEVVFQGESNEIKLGCIAPFITDEDIVSNEEMKRMRAERWLRGRSSERCTVRRRSKPRRDFTYRHVRVLNEPNDSPPRRVRKIAFTNEDEAKTYNYEPAHRPRRPPVGTTTSMQVQPTATTPSMPSKTVKSTVLRDTDSAKAFVPSKASSSSTRSGSDCTIRVSAKLSKESQPGHTESEIRKITREEIERCGIATQKLDWTERDIRRISREEVQRYREAERKLEVHPDAFAHGRMVPMQRCIDVERDVAVPMPWTDSSKEDIKVSSEVRRKPQNTDDPHASDAKPQPKANEAEKIAPPKQDSWAPKWRCELSLERQSNGESWDVKYKKAGRNRQLASNAPERDTPASVKLREVYDVVEESNPPRWSSRAEPYVIHPERNKSNDKRNIIEVAEEIEIPPKKARERVDTQNSAPPPMGRPEAPWREHAKKREIGYTAHRKFYKPQELPPQFTSKEEQRTWSRSSRPTDRGYWYNESAVQTLDSRSSKQYQTSGSGGTPRESKPGSSQTNELSSHRLQKEHFNIHADRASEKTSWPEPRDVGRSARNNSQSKFSSSGRGKQASYAQKDEHMKIHATVNSEKQSLPELRVKEPAEDSAWPKEREDPPYQESNPIQYRVVRPRDTTTEKSCRARPPKTNHPTGDPDAEYIYTERILQPADRPQGRWPFDNVPTTPRGEVEEYWETKTHPQKQAPASRVEIQQHPETGRHPKEQAAAPSRQHKERRKAKVRDSEESNHVRFSNKVHISPTPPNSDASSSEFRSFHSSRRGHSQQIDGHRSPERGEDLIAEYERRGRTRSRDTRAVHDYHYDRESVCEHVRSGSSTIKPRRKHGEWKYDGKGGRPLDRALSESPSREAMIAELKQEKVDGRGPYRVEERITDSMQVHDGSQDRQRGDGKGRHIVPRQ